MIRLKSAKDIEGLRASGEILARVLRELRNAAHEGVSLCSLDELARKLLKEAGAGSAFLGYRPEGSTKAYPAAICTSVNKQVVHGLPTDYVLKSGDVLKIDTGVSYRGYITDSATTVAIGPVSKEIKKLMEVTERALSDAIGACKKGNRLGDVGWAVEDAAKKSGFSVVRGLTGHGVGFKLHEDPAVYNYGNRGEGMELKPGLVLAIEPMISIGKGDVMQEADDSFVTRDGSVSAHFEHTVAITSAGPETLTVL